MTTITKDTNFNMRINRQKKSELESLYARLGMTLPEAVNIFFENSLLVGGIPFDVRLPNYDQVTDAAAFRQLKGIAKRELSIDEVREERLDEIAHRYQRHP